VVGGVNGLTEDEAEVAVHERGSVDDGVEVAVHEGDGSLS
jgi:hypothetical protein